MSIYCVVRTGWGSVYVEEFESERIASDRVTEAGHTVLAFHESEDDAQDKKLAVSLGDLDPSDTVGAALTSVEHHVRAAYERTMCDGVGCCGDIDAAIRVAIGQTLRQVVGRAMSAEEMVEMITRISEEV